MRSNKINNADLFTSAANDKFGKHIKTQSKQALEIIKTRINWNKLIKPIGATIRSVVLGVLGVAAIQALVSGIVMLIFNIPLAGLWALIVLFLAIIQLPPLIILIPGAAYSFSILDTTSAIIFLVLCIFISLSDAFLKPIFLGRGVDVPTLVILLGAIDGTTLFGVIGLFVGAVVLAIAYKVYQALLEDTSLPEEDIVKEN